MIYDEETRKFYLPEKYWGLDRIFNIRFEIGGVETQYTKTDLKTYLTIMSTIVDIIKHFIERNDYIDGIYFRGNRLSLRKSNQKINFYETILYNKLNEFPHFTAEKFKNGFIIVNKENFT